MKLLYNKQTELLQPYPRSDDAEVVGLDTSVYEVFTVIQNQAPPTLVEGFRLQPTQIIDVAAKTVTRGFELVAIEPSPPLTVSMTSLKLALDAVGMYASVAAAIASAPAKMQILWLNPTAARDNTDLNAFAESLGMTSAQIDAIFAAAAQLDTTS